MRAAQWVLCCILGWPVLGAAQLRLPVSVPTHAPNLPGALSGLPGAGTLDAIGQGVTSARRSLVRELLRAYPRELAADPRGELIVRDEILALAPSQPERAAALRLGFAVVREQLLDGLDLPMVVLRPPPHISIRKALELLKHANPEGIYDFNHLYMPSGAEFSTDGANGSATSSEPVRSAETRTEMAPPRRLQPSRIRLGLIDTGIDQSHEVFHSASIVTFGCKGVLHPAAHGTAVASLLIGDDSGFHGAAPGAALFAADVYCDEPTGGSAATLASAFAWLATQHVEVVNISLVGPDNAALARIIAAFQSHGGLIVAAVGNDGPAAPPLYPASYTGVVGVTGVDARRHVLLEAARGPQVMFAALGVGSAALVRGGLAPVRGTSFAAPIVAALLARNRSTTGKTAAAAVEALAASALDLGGRGRDLTYGLGLVGAEFSFAGTK